MKYLLIILIVIISGCVRTVPTSRKGMRRTKQGIVHKSQVKDLRHWRKKYQKL